MESNVGLSSFVPKGVKIETVGLDYVSETIKGVQIETVDLDPVCETSPVSQTVELDPALIQIETVDLDPVLLETVELDPALITFQNDQFCFHIVT